MTVESGGIIEKAVATALVAVVGALVYAFKKWAPSPAKDRDKLNQELAREVKRCHDEIRELSGRYRELQDELDDVRDKCRDAEDREDKLKLTIRMLRSPFGEEIRREKGKGLNDSTNGA